MALDKWIAVVFLVICVIYGYSAYTYPLLPFERNMTFLPNTMPMVLSVLGVSLALLILLALQARKPMPRVMRWAISILKSGVNIKLGRPWG